MSHAQTSGYGLGLGALVGVAKRWSAGLSGSAQFFPAAFSVSATSSGAYSYVPIPTGFIRIDAEARYHALMRRMLDVWVGPAAGLGLVWLYGYYRLPALHMGAGAGINFLPSPYLSIGLAARGGALVLDIPKAGPHTYAQGAFAFVLGFHLSFTRAPVRTTW